MARAIGRFRCGVSRDHCVDNHEVEDAIFSWWMTSPAHSGSVLQELLRPLLMVLNNEPLWRISGRRFQIFNLKAFLLRPFLGGKLSEMGSFVPKRLFSRPIRREK